MYNHPEGNMLLFLVLYLYSILPIQYYNQARVHDRAPGALAPPSALKF